MCWDCIRYIFQILPCRHFECGFASASYCLTALYKYFFRICQTPSFNPCWLLVSTMLCSKDPYRKCSLILGIRCLLLLVLLPDDINTCLQLSCWETVIISSQFVFPNHSWSLSTCPLSYSLSEKSQINCRKMFLPCQCCLRWTHRLFGMQTPAGTGCLHVYICVCVHTSHFYHTASCPLQHCLEQNWGGNLRWVQVLFLSHSLQDISHRNSVTPWTDGKKKVDLSLNKE